MDHPAIKPGTVGHFQHVVEERHCTQRGEHKIFSTPNMVQFLEWAAIEALKPALRPDQISVGTHVDVKHLAPTPLGMRIRAQATVREVDGARVVFDVELFDEVDTVGKASHERYVLDLDRYMRRLEKKVAAANVLKETAQ
jgi:fluoroacetyl-CoA thioesterase